MLEPLKKIIREHQKSDPQILFAPQICYFAQSALISLGIGEKEARAVSFKSGRLKIATVNPVISHRIKLNEEDIIKKN